MKRLLLLISFSIVPLALFSQVTTVPSNPTDNEEITILFDATGTSLDGYTGDVYAFTGVTVNGGQFSNVLGDWGDNVVNPQLTRDAINLNLYTLLITPTIFDYYGVSTSDNITELVFIFRSADASLQTNPDIFIPIIATNPPPPPPVLSNWGIVGTATPNGWNGPDLPLTYDAVSNKWSAIVLLTNGEIKFRDNNSWNVNYGDNEPDGILERNGANIAIAEGYYLITCDFSALTYAIKSLVSIPDPNFEQALIDLGIDSDGTLNGIILKENVVNIDSLSIGSPLDHSKPFANPLLVNVIAKIADLTGIEAFTNLKYLSAGFNNIISINLSQNTLLEELWINDNDCSFINVSNNPNLKKIGAYVNNLTALDLSNNPLLTHLYLAYNPQLKYLDVRNGNNSNISAFWVLETPNLACINADIINSQVMIDSGKAFNENCGDFVYIPDPNFEQALIDLGFDSDGAVNSLILKSDADLVIDLDLNNKNISSLAGIEHFVNLQYLFCHNNLLTELNLGNMPNLTILDCSHNALTSIDVLNYPNLVTLSIWGNQLTILDVSNNPNLEELQTTNNKLTSMDISANSKLKFMNFANNKLVNLNIANGNNANLTKLDWSDYSFDARWNPALMCIQVDADMINNIPSDWFKDEATNYNDNCPIINCDEFVAIPDANFEQALIDLGYDTNGLTGTIKKCDAASIIDLDLNNKNISSLAGIEHFVGLRYLNCYNNLLTEVNLGDKPNLINLDLGINSLTTIDVSNCPNLVSFSIWNNQLTTLDVSNNPNLEELICFLNKLTTLDISINAKLKFLNFSSNKLVNLNIANGNNINFLGPEGAGFSFYATNNPALMCIQVDAGMIDNIPSDWFKDEAANYNDNCPIINCDDLVAIPDANFEQALIDLGFDTNGLTGNIKKCEALSITHLNVNEKNISSLSGIEHFTNLQYLYCNNNLLTTLNLGDKPNLINLDCGRNALTSIDVSSYPKLINLDIWNNQLLSLDVSQNLQLEALIIFSNKLTTLDISMNTKLKFMNFSNNKLVNLNIANGNNVNFSGPEWAGYSFYATNNPALMCIQVDAGIINNIPSDWFKDDTANYNENCPIINCEELVAIPDANFEQALIDLGYDTNGLTGDIKKCDAAAVNSLDIHDRNITDLTGIEAFVNLKALYPYGNQLLALDVSNNTLLEQLLLNDNQVLNLDLSNNTLLKGLNIDRNSMENLILGNHPDLSFIYGSGNALTSIDVLNCPKLKTLSVGGSKLTNVDLTSNGLLEEIIVHWNLLTELDISTNPNVSFLLCEGNQLTSLNIANGNNLNFVKPVEAVWTEFSFSASDNSNLKCIQVDADIIDNIPSDWFKDETTSYNATCENTNCDIITSANVKIFPGPFNTGDIKSGMTFGGSGLDRPNTFQQGMVATTDGGYIFTGWTFSIDGDLQGIKTDTASDILVVKLDCSFNIQWKKIYGGSGFENGFAVIQTADEGYMIAGSANSSVSGDVSASFGGNDAWLIKLDANGNKQWEKSFGGSNHESFTGVAQTLSGDYIVVGNTDSTDGDLVATISKGGQDMWVVKVSNTGTIINQRRIGGTGNLDVSSHIVRTNDGNYLLTGYTDSVDGDITFNKGDRDGYLDKMDENLNKLWAKTYGGSGGELFMMTKPTNDGGYISTGLVSSSENGDIKGMGNGGFDVWIVKLAADGSIQWERNYGGPNSEQGQSIDLAEDGGYVVGGLSSIDGGDVAGFKGTFDSWTLRLDSNGNLLWQKPYGGSGNESMAVLLKNAAGELITLSRTNSSDGDLSAFNNNGNYDFWITRVADCTSFITATVTASRTLNTLAPVVLTANTGSGYTYQWYLNNAKIIGETNGTYTATAIGSYKVAISAPNSCTGYSSPITITESANEFYVNDTNQTGDLYTTAIGSNTNPGTAALPFATIQHAINEVAVGGVIYVDAGIYMEDVIVNKGVTLNGVQAGVNPESSLTRGVETIVVPATADPFNRSVFILQASDITIDGFTIDGDNPTITGSVLLNGSDINAGFGIAKFIEPTAYNNLNIRNNIIKNFYRYGVFIQSTSEIPLSGNLITQNHFTNISAQNVDGNIGRWGRAIGLFGNAYASISQNVFTKVSTAVWVVNFNAVSTDNSFITGNIIESYLSGIEFSRFSEGANRYQVNNNAISTGDLNTWNVPGASTSNINYGIMAYYISNTSGQSFHNNTIINTETGLFLYYNISSIPGWAINVHNNSITETIGYAIQNSEGNKVNATCNWYGSTAVQDNLNKVTAQTGYFVPFLTNGSDNDPLTLGFQPVPDSCNGWPLSASVTSKSDITCFGANDGSINISIDNLFIGKVPYIYLWTKDGEPEFSSSVEDPSNLSPGTYRVTITDDWGTNVLVDYDGNIITIEVDINEPEVLSATANVINNICFAGNTGSIIVTALGGTAPYSYLWSNGGTEDQISNLTQGIYSVLITDANGCTSNSQYEITQPAQIVLQLTDLSTACSNIATVSVQGGTGSYTYLWSNGATTPTISAVAVGTYTVLVTDANGCTMSGNIVLAVKEAFNPSASIINVSCNGGSDGRITIGNVNGQAPFSYSIDGINFIQDQNQFSNLRAGTYTIGVRDANGCTGFVTKTIGEPVPIAINVDNVQGTCAGVNAGSISISTSGGSPGYSYNWTGPNSYISSSKNISNLAAGTYSIKVTDTKGCSITISDIVVSTTSAIVVAETVTHIACKGETNGSINLSVSGGSGNGFNYSWSVGGATGNSIANLSVGNYGVIITDIGTGCTVTKSFAITQPATNVSISVSKQNATGCNSMGTIIITASGGTGPSYTYKLDNGSYGSENVFSNLQGRDDPYMVWVKDSKGCTTSKAIYITDNGSDEFEGNNSKNQAKAINIGATINARIGSLIDVDWFKFVVPTGGGNYILNVTHESVNYTFNLYSSVKNASVISPVNQSGSSKEFNLIAGTYFVEIVGALSFKCYNLSVNPVISVYVKTASSQTENEINNEVDKQGEVEFTVLNAIAYPNPSSLFFTLKIQGMSLENVVNVSVYDLLGRLLFTKSGSINDEYRFGEEFLVGVYLVKVQQGTEMVSLRVIKK